jgi:uncharacterized membrane protein
VRLQRAAWRAEVAVIESVAGGMEGEARHWVLRPNHSLTRKQVRLFFGLVVLTALLVTGFSWSHGNVFAPAFAVFEIGVLAAVFWVVARRAERAEVIRIQPERVSVRRIPELEEALDEHPRWVRVECIEGWVVLSCRGRQVRVGEFLGEAERESLRKDLERGLKQARDHSVYRYSENVG